MAVLAGIGAEKLPGKGWIRILTVGFVALDLIAVSSGRPINTNTFREDPGFSERQFGGSVEKLEKVRILTRRTDPPSRVDTYDDDLDWAMGAPVTGVPTANGNDPFALERYMQVRLSFCKGKRWGRYYQVNNLRSPVLSLLNVRIVLSHHDLPGAALGDELYKEVAEVPGGKVFERAEVLPRFFLVDHVIQAKGMDEALQMVRSDSFDSRTTAVVEDAIAESNQYDRRDGSVHLEWYGNGSILLDVRSSRPVFLVTSEAWYPGWIGLIDGKEHPLVRTNVAFRGLAVPAGLHRIEMRFAPRMLWYGLVVSLVSIGFIGALKRIQR